MSRIVLAFDKFRGTASRARLHEAAFGALGRHDVTEVLLSDGGEGSLESFGGANRHTTVTGPLGDPVRAGWRLDGDVAWIEMCAASGLDLIGGPEGNDAIAASTYGTGELIAAAVDAGAAEITVFVGGSATTDGGFGAVRALPIAPRLRAIDLTVATDVTTTFVEAASVFAPQKGASPTEVRFLTNRLERLADMYLDTYGVDVRSVAGSGGAGGLVGGLFAIGATIASGFDVLADSVRLDEAIDGADLVITGEGSCDPPSFEGKVVGGVASWAGRQGVPVIVVCGRCSLDRKELPAHVTLISLTERFGDEAASARPTELLARVLTEEFG